MGGYCKQEQQGQSSLGKGTGHFREILAAKGQAQGFGNVPEEPAGNGHGVKE